MSEGIQDKKGRKQKRPTSGKEDQKQKVPRGGTAARIDQSRVAVEIYGSLLQKKPREVLGGSLPNEVLFNYLSNLVDSLQGNEESLSKRAAASLLSTLEFTLARENSGEPLLQTSQWEQGLAQKIARALRLSPILREDSRAIAIVQKLKPFVGDELWLKMDVSVASEGRTVTQSIGILNVLADVGPACSWSTQSFRETLSGIATSLLGGELDESSISLILYFFSDKYKRVDDASDSNWNIAVATQVLSEDYGSLDWGKVAEMWDFESFDIQSSEQLQTLFDLFRAGAKRDPPLTALTSDWKYPAGQCSVLDTMLSSPAVYQCPLDSEEAADAATAGEAKTATNPRCWASSAVLKRLLLLSEISALARKIRDLFVKGLLSCPEVLLCALMRLQLNSASATPGKQMTGELMKELIPLFFKPNPHHAVQNGPAAVRRLWAISPNAVSAASIEAWRSTVAEAPQARLATVVHIISIIRLLPSPESAMASILNGSKDPEFSLAIAFVMADNEMLQLKAWLTERISSASSAAAGGLYAVTLIAYLGKTYQSATPRAGSDGKGAPLVSLENVAVSLQFLQGLDPAILSQTIASSVGSGDGRSANGVTVAESVKSLSDACLSAHPSLRTSIGQRQTQEAPGGATTSGRVTPTSSTGSADDIEEIANSYFQKIYTSEQSIGEVVEMLKRFKASSDSRENDIFACMIHNLFDEYRFFPKYPEKELRITGILFGTLIQEQLVSSITLGIALRYVLEALRKPPAPASSTTHSSGKMFRFGMFALEQFKGRLHEWPQYCSHIVQIPHLKEGYADLVTEIEGAMAESRNRSSGSSSAAGGSVASSNSAKDARGSQKQKGGQSPVPTTTPSKMSEKSIPTQVELPMSAAAVKPQAEQRVAVFGPKLGRAVNGKMDDSQHESPPDAVLDRVQFLINNVSLSNVELKAQELKDMLEPAYFGWLGHYLVVKRISTQPNFHSLYLTFLDQLGDYGKGLVESILSSVYLNVGKLLRSPKITTSTSERSLLKNLGSWLGQITLAKNRPILQIMLDCKELLFQGYENGMLIAVTPFVAKILEGAKNSVVFRPPNPWLMGLLSVFRALYMLEDLKMNIKFEVEVLCKNLGLKADEIPLRTDLSTRIPPVKERNPDFNMKSSMIAQSSSSSGGPSGVQMPGAAKLTSPDGKSLGSSVAMGSSGNYGAGGQGSGGGQDQTVIPNLSSYVTINPSLNQLLQQSAGSTTSSALFSTTLKRSIPLAVDRAIREIIQPIVERSVSIACITTKEIVVKDFAMESDETKLRKGAQLMVANLAGSLALVTCREPLRTSIATQLRQLLANTIGPTEKLTEQEQNVVEQCVAICATDNLELGCMLIEKAATEKAIRDIEEAISPAVNTRRKHREQTGHPYYDMSIFGNGKRYPASLPEPLRPTPGGLRSEQLRVYEAFQKPSRQTAAAAPFGTPTAGPAARGSGSLTPASSVGSEGSAAPGQQVNVEVLTAIATKLNSSVTNLLASVGTRAPEITLSMIPADHEIRQLLLSVQRVMPNSASSGGNPRSLTSAEKEAILGFSQTVFKRLYELSLSEPLRLEALVALLENINTYCPALSQNIGTWATYAPTDTEIQRKLHRTVLLLLMRSRLASAADLDSFLARNADNGRHPVWVEFSLLFIRTAFLERLAAPSDFPKLMDLMTKIAEGRSQASPHVTQSLRKPILRMLEELRGPKPNADTKVVGSSSLSSQPEKKRLQPVSLQESSSLSALALSRFNEAPQKVLETTESLMRSDPPNAKQQVMFLLDIWIRKHGESGGGDQFLAQYLQLLQQNEVGKSEEQTERFLRLSTLAVVEAVQKTSGGSDGVGDGAGMNYNFIDLYTNLTVELVRHMNKGGSDEQVGIQRVALLNKVVGVMVRCLVWDCMKTRADAANRHWDQRPWFRLLLNLTLDLNAPSPMFDPIRYGILSVLGAAFHMLQPFVVPGFAFAWLDLISNRFFLRNLLDLKEQKGWHVAHQLVIDLLLFLEPHLKMAELSAPIKKLYEGTLRLLLTLLKDFPSFLAAYHLSLCNVIPDHCVQLRNLVLSAVPRGMVLPDPFTPNLKIDLLPEISQSPVIMSDILGPIEGLRSDLDTFLKDKQWGDFMNGLLPRLCKEGTNVIDAPKVNSLVLYVGMRAMASPQNTQLSNTILQTPEMEVLFKLMEFGEKGRYISLNAIANQLRYPSSHTHFFSCVMLFIFSESKNVAVKEQVTRVLLERLILHKPHPWGLLITFIELIKNQRYQFWSHPFTRCANELEKVFDSVARTCMVPGTQRSASVGGGDDRAQ